MSYIENVKSSKKCSGYPIEKIFNTMDSKEGLERIKHLSVPNGLYIKHCENPCVISQMYEEIIDDDMFDIFDKKVLYNKNNFSRRRNPSNRNSTAKKK
jgi:hypothetical protein